MNVLTQRNLKGLNVEGSVLVNGENLGRDIAAVSGYVRQEDLLVGTLTVSEHLWFLVRNSTVPPDHSERI